MFNTNLASVESRSGMSDWACADRTVEEGDVTDICGSMCLLLELLLLLLMLLVTS